MARLEHVGIAVDDVSRLSGVLSELLGESPFLAEALRADGIRTHFVWGGSVKLELLEEVEDGSVLSTFLRKRGPGLHHLAFEVDDVQAMHERARKAGFEPVDPAPRPGADGKLIFFLHPRQTHGVLIEFCQSVRPALLPASLPVVRGVRAVAMAGGSAARPACVYVFDDPAALPPRRLADRLGPQRTFFAAEASSSLQIADLLDALNLDAVHLVVSAPLIRSVSGPAVDRRIRSLILIDPEVLDAERIDAAGAPLLVLTATDQSGLRRAAAWRSREPAARLAAASDADIRAAIIVSHLERLAS